MADPGAAPTGPAGEPTELHLISNADHFMFGEQCPRLACCAAGSRSICRPPRRPRTAPPRADICAALRNRDT